MSTTTDRRATTTTLAARRARPRLELRWTVRETPGTTPALVARWVTGEVAASQHPVAA